ncbi:MAG TPA: hypothetical protein VJL10_04385 [Anaerolineales bacterium]|nr:hypothetical protein [Anaerolineales bacterium]
MLTPSDLIHLPYTPDLTESGIAFALRSLTHSFDRKGSSPYDRLRRDVANVAVELAFRRYLSQQNIPFEVKAATPFTDHERYDVTLGGRRCDLKSYLISHRAQIAEMRRNPAVLLNAPALVPSDHHASDGHSYNDLYLFAFLSGLIAASQADLKKVVESKQPHYLIHAMPEEWRKPLNWNPLGALMLKSDSEDELLIEISGQDQGRELKRYTVSLAPKTKIVVTESFYSLTSLHVRRVPDARVGVRCEAITEAHIISQLEWGNIWVYGMEIFLAGYISHEEFSQRANFLLPNSKVFQYEHTRVKNLSLPISNLKPIQNLLTFADK